MGYKKDAIIGISWGGTYRLFTRGLAYLKVAILARVLSPAQFGVFGIASLVLAFLEMLTETGINVFLVQSKERIEEYLDTAWVISILRGIIISAVLIIFTPVIVSFFNSPEATNVLLLMSIVPFLRGFINPAVIIFQKELYFRKDFLYRSSVFFFDTAVSISAALITHSVYSLVWGLIAGVILEVFLSYVLVDIKPKLAINKAYFAKIFHSGKWVTGYGIFNYIAQELDTIIVGKLLGTASLGIYQMAYRISTLPISEVTEVVSKVTFPVYAKIEHDKKRLRNAFFKSTAVIALVVTCIGIIIFLFPEQLVLILLGPQWLSVVPLLKILAFYGFLRAITGSVTALFLGVGKQQYITLMTFVRFSMLAIAIYPLVSLYGTIGAAYAVVLSVLIETPLVAFLLARVFR